MIVGQILDIIDGNRPSSHSSVHSAIKYASFLYFFHAAVLDGCIRFFDMLLVCTFAVAGKNIWSRFQVFLEKKTMNLTVLLPELVIFVVRQGIIIAGIPNRDFLWRGVI